MRNRLSLYYFMRMLGLLFLLFLITLDQLIQTYMQQTPANEVQQEQAGNIDTPSQQAI